MSITVERTIALSEMVKFIYRSKKKGFMSKDEKTDLVGGVTIYSNRELPWLYNDIYCGNTVERGSEDVYYEMILVWSMQYRGGVIEEFYCEKRYDETTKVVSSFLKQALINMPIEFPVRGPKHFMMDEVHHGNKIYKGKFVYVNQWTGDMKKFVGYEEIYWNSKNVYYHNYMGGLIRNRYFPIKVI